MQIVVPATANCRGGFLVYTGCFATPERAHAFSGVESADSIT